MRTVERQVIGSCQNAEVSICLLTGSGKVASIVRVYKTILTKIHVCCQEIY